MTVHVSVICPVFNNSMGIRKNLNALLTQTYPKRFYEIIVVDNNSKDETSKILQRYQEQNPKIIKVLLETSAQSSYVARNKGVQAAKGEILAFTDSDCIPEEDWIEKGIKSIADTKASFVAGQVKFFFRTQQPNICEYFDIVKRLTQQHYVNTGYGMTANLFVRKELFKRYGFFRNDLQSGGDYEFGHRLTKGGEKLIYAEDSIVLHPLCNIFRTLYERHTRIIKGHKKLKELGLLQNGNISLTSFLPKLRFPSIKDISLKTFQKISIVFLNNFFHYYRTIKLLC